MSIEQIVGEYLGFVWSAFQFDMNAFSQWWMYALMLIPACAYFVFFLFKWFVITLPIWLPIVMILGAVRQLFIPKVAEPSKIKHESDNKG